MTITVLFFAHLRDLAGTDSIKLEANGVDYARDLISLMRGQLSDELVEAIADESAMVSINHQYAGWDAVLKDGDEVGILPPVSGG